MTSATESAKANGFRVLVADDEQGIVWLWARILRWSFDAEVVAVFDGASAVGRIRDGHFDLVITDLQMPGASGLDVLRAATRHAPPIPVVLCTGHAPAHVVTEASALGVGKILTKPFDIDDAAEVVRRVLPVAGPACPEHVHASHCH